MRESSLVVSVLGTQSDSEVEKAGLKSLLNIHIYRRLHRRDKGCAKYTSPFI
jgi:hypothetical protein